MVVGFTTICAISAYHPIHCEVHSIQHYEIKFVSDFWHVSGFLRVPRFPPPIKIDRHDIAEILLTVTLKHHKPKPSQKRSLKLISSKCSSLCLTTSLLCLVEVFFQQSAYLWVLTALPFSPICSFIPTRKTSYRIFSRTKKACAIL